jgi:hypothetical protein
MIQDIRKVYNKYKNYNYIDLNFDNYHIKTPKEFDSLQGGICWDFVGPIAEELDKYNIPWKCYYTGIHKGDRTLATHTYIIADGKYWIECSWRKYKGLNTISSYKDIEDLLLESYHGEKAYTVEYNPLDTFGMTDQEFFDYLEHYGKELF